MNRDLAHRYYSVYRNIVTVMFEGIKYTVMPSEYFGQTTENVYMKAFNSLTSASNIRVPSNYTDVNAASFIMFRQELRRVLKLEYLFNCVDLIGIQDVFTGSLEDCRVFIPLSKLKVMFPYTQQLCGEYHLLGVLKLNKVGKYYIDPFDIYKAKGFSLPYKKKFIEERKYALQKLFSTNRNRHNTANWGK